jgi:hypothetical protein
MIIAKTAKDARLVILYAVLTAKVRQSEFVFAIPVNTLKAMANKSGYGLVVECVLAKDETRVRFPVAAHFSK